MINSVMTEARTEAIPRTMFSNHIKGVSSLIAANQGNDTQLQWKLPRKVISWLMHIVIYNSFRRGSHSFEAG